MSAADAPAPIRSTIPARLDRLGWSPFHTRMVAGLFFFASAGASAAYLTVSETWPIEIRAEAIAVFFAIAQIFGAFGPAFYGALIGNGTDPTGLYIGYVVGGAIMIVGGIVELAIGIKAEGKSLEDITTPITSTSADRGGQAEPPPPLALA